MPEKSNKKQDDLVIVGIGASAGGLEALRALIPTLPVQKNLTFIIAQHMDPKHSSMLAAILERDTNMPIEEITDGQILRASVLHIVPPGMHAQLKGLKVHLQKATGIGSKPSIDRLFVSLAEEHGERVVGIILSGTGADGAHGIPLIKAEGGITIAQDEDSAKFSSMPHSAIATGHVDLILSPDKIGTQLSDLIRYPRIIPAIERDTHPTDYFMRILRLVLDHTGDDFRDYKVSTIGRRIERRMVVHKLYDMSDYVALLEKQPEELVELHQDILISVTAFFRDKAAFLALSKQFKQIIHKDSDTIRIWVAGCATGQEAYSTAILLSEYLGKRIHRYHVQIFATDLDEEALAVAHQGIYPKVAIEDIEPKLLDKYFGRHGDAWQLIPSIRDMVMFAKHSLVKDPPFSHLDLITCRNVLIYFNGALQKCVFQTFHYALRDKGVLFLGKSETTGTNECLFAPIALHERLYIKRGEIKPQLPHIISINKSKTAYHALEALNKERREPLDDEKSSELTRAPVDNRRIKALEEELREMRESLQTTIEELETSNEELQSTYEEAQSTNEELYTSTEELQSTNEELRTVNQEIVVKNAEIEASNERLTNEIEERRRAEDLVVEKERKLRMIINSEPAWVNICDSDGVILEVNPAGVEIMEADSAKELIGKKLLDLVMDKHKQDLRVCQELASVGETHKQAVSVKTLKGNMRWLEISTVRLPDEVDNKVQTMSIICDQTQFKEAHDKALQGQTELAHVMRLNTLGAMASGLAHELNQPLSSIANYLSGCERRVRNNSCQQEEVLDVLGLANIQVQRAGEIINQVKHFIKQDGRETEAVHINAAIENAVELARGTGQCNHARIELAFTEPLAFVLANKVQIEQVIINLVLNGIEAMDEVLANLFSLFVHNRWVKKSRSWLKIVAQGYLLVKKWKFLNLFIPLKQMAWEWACV
jgi:PAS domain S-box-containing protein